MDEICPNISKNKFSLFSSDVTNSISWCGIISFFAMLWINSCREDEKRKNYNQASILKLGGIDIKLGKSRLKK